MRYFSLTLLMLCILFTSCKQDENTNKQLQKNNINQEETEAIIDTWLTLWKTYDLNLLDDIFITSEELTYFSSEKKGLIQGFSKMKPHHEAFGFTDGGKTPEKSLWLENITTNIYGETAMVGAIWYFGDKAISKDSVQQGPVTFVLKRNPNNQVRIVHTHFANY